MDESSQPGEPIRPAPELHELANLLSAIRLSADFALRTATPGDATAKDLQTIIEAADRGAEMVERLQARAARTG